MATYAVYTPHRGTWLVRIPFNSGWLHQLLCFLSQIWRRYTSPAGPPSQPLSEHALHSMAGYDEFVTQTALICGSIKFAAAQQPPVLVVLPPQMPQPPPWPWHPAGHQGGGGQQQQQQQPLLVRHCVAPSFNNVRALGLNGGPLLEER